MVWLGLALSCGTNRYHPDVSGFNFNGLFLADGPFPVSAAKMDTLARCAHGVSSDTPGVATILTSCRPQWCEEEGHALILACITDQTRPASGTSHLDLHLVRRTGHRVSPSHQEVQATFLDSLGELAVTDNHSTLDKHLLVDGPSPGPVVSVSLFSEVLS